MIALEVEEEFYFSLCNDVACVHKSDILDVLEDISDFEIDPFTFIDPILPVNSCLIACTNYHNFIEEGENCTFSISMAHKGLFFPILEADITLFGSKLNFQGF